uniref:Reverse transcriptase n=1 Tax=Tanacetum cinerariifolium TaxID=118510 RepID=A0A6L2JAM0_TANCI|nr:reverse transcriptase [Tanacetum cinerariifolium]
MPFGLSNAPSTFQSAMNDIFRDVLRRFVLVFFDDILIYSSTLEEHYEHLRHVFSTLSEHRYYAKLSKCVFGVTEVQYLGHIISSAGVATDPEKIQSIQEWSKPTSITGLRGFLGLTGYYRRFVKGYAQIAAPLTDLLQQHQITWNDQAEQAFNTLKAAMTTLPVLALPDFTVTFDVTTDASGIGIGAVLSQNDKPISFFRIKLCPRMRSASTYIRELYAITEAVKKWRQYLLGRKFRIFTDQRSLKHLLTQVMQTPDQHKWAAKLLGYDFDVYYKPGKENQAADALSRIETPQVFTLSVPTFPWIQELRDYYKNSTGQNLIDRASKQPDTLPGYSVHDGLLYVHNQLFMPSLPSLRQKLLTEFHSSLIGGHSGINATIRRLNGSFFWPHLWEEISMDFITNLPLSNGKSAIWVIVDRLSKFAHFIALLPHSTAASLATLSCLERLALNSCTQVPITRKQTVKRKCAIEMSPFQALYGRPPPSIPHYTLGSSQVASIDTTLMEHQRLVSLLKVTLQRTCQRMSEQANKHRMAKEFQVGDMVYLRLRVYRQTSVAKRDVQKLSKRCFGPFKITERIGKVSYRLELPSGTRIHPIFHVSLLRPSYGSPNPSNLPLPITYIDDIPILEPETILDQHNIEKNGITILQVLIKWLGRDLSEATWENKDDIQLPGAAQELEDKVDANEGGIDKNPATTRPTRVIRRPSRYED